MTAGKPTILYIHNDLRPLIAFDALFSKEYAIFSTSSTAEALLLLSKQGIAVLIADQCLRSSSGIAFLQATHADFPDPVKMLIYQKEDVADVISPENTGSIDFYLNKFCESFEFKTSVKNAANLFCMREEVGEKNLLLQKTKNELEKFVYTISHDLKSPLNSVKGIVNLAKTETGYEGQEYLSLIEKSVLKLDGLLAKSVNYYQNTKTGCQPSDVHFEDMIQKTWDSFDGIEDKSTIQFQIKVEQTDKAFKTDEFRLQIILNAVLSNAIRFQDKTRTAPFVTIDVNIFGGLATLLIKDNGTGIGAEELSRIFSIFYKGAQEKCGAGLGLYIAREAADSIGGTVEVFSEKGKGSVFKILIPCMSDPTAQ